MSLEQSSWSPSESASATQDAFSEIETWIEQNAVRPENVGEVVERLTALTLPSQPWNPSDTVNPLGGDLEAQFWFWNRAANHFLGRGHFQAAVEVWSAHYLSYLSLQLRYHHRYHKGMPLCNIGYAFARAGRARLAVRSWLLGVVEDSLTDVSTATEAVSYQNLRKMRVAPAVLSQLIATVESRFLSQSTVPLFPESVIELWLNPTLVVASETCMKSLGLLSESLARCYPKLPNSTHPLEETLHPFWGFADWVNGVSYGQ
jgi:hypothetical protein